MFKTNLNTWVKKRNILRKKNKRKWKQKEEWTKLFRHVWILQNVYSVLKLQDN